MNRREFVKAIGYGALGLTASGCSFRDRITDTLKPMKKPNIVLIAIDDMGWADIGYHNPEIKSPHLDRMAREGVELDQHYVQPQCTPTRVALMTGRYPSRFGRQCTTALNLQSYPLGTVTLNYLFLRQRRISKLPGRKLPPAGPQVDQFQFQRPVARVKDPDL